jgi:hypothetical protein
MHSTQCGVRVREIGAEVCATAFLALESGFHDLYPKQDHVAQLD